MALNGIVCANVLRPLDFVRLIDFTYKYQPELLGVTNPADNSINMICIDLLPVHIVYADINQYTLSSTNFTCIKVVQNVLAESTP